jgi:hypothetical protein
MSERHMSWCAGDHDKFGDCEVSFEIDQKLTSGNAGADLTGTPCGSILVIVEGTFDSVEDLDAFIDRLTGLRNLMAGSVGEVDCDGGHPAGFACDTYADEDDDEAEEGNFEDDEEYADA